MRCNSLADFGGCLRLWAGYLGGGGWGGPVGLDGLRGL